MRIDDVLKLINAGFTADEVRAMGAGADAVPDPAELSEETQSADAAPVADEAPQEEPEKAPEQVQFMTAEDVRRIVRAQLKAAEQAANARTADRGGQEKPLTADDVIRELTKRL